MRLSHIVTAAIAAPLAFAAPATVNSKAVGRLFSLNGKVEYFAGTNAWWLGHLFEDADVTVTFEDLASSHEKIVRVWGFGNSNVNTTSEVYFQIINETIPGLHTAINYASNGIARLDAVVAAAEKYGVGLVLPMLNNWDDLGGIQTYCNVYGCNGTTFYSNELAQAAYRNYVKFIVNRYKHSSAIFAWELCNEPRCHGCNTSVIYNWASSVSSYIKSLDQTHMVTLGDEGWLCSGGDGSYAYSCAEGVDFQLNLNIPTLDYGTFHLYPDSWGYNESWGNEWIIQHDLIGKAANKPVVLEEYGAAINMTYYESQWQNTVLTKTEIAADQFWQFSANLPSGTNDGDIYDVTYGTEQYQILGTTHAEKMLEKNIHKQYD